MHASLRLIRTGTPVPLIDEKHNLLALQNQRACMGDQQDLAKRLLVLQSFLCRHAGDQRDLTAELSVVLDVVGQHSNMAGIRELWQLRRDRRSLESRVARHALNLRDDPLAHGKLMP